MPGDGSHVPGALEAGGRHRHRLLPSVQGPGRILEGAGAAFSPRQLRSPVGDDAAGCISATLPGQPALAGLSVPWAQPPTWQLPWTSLLFSGPGAEEREAAGELGSQQGQVQGKQGTRGARAQLGRLPSLHGGRRRSPASCPGAGLGIQFWFLCLGCHRPHSSGCLVSTCSGPGPRGWGSEPPLRYLCWARSSSARSRRLLLRPGSDHLSKPPPLALTVFR